MIFVFYRACAHFSMLVSPGSRNLKERRKLLHKVIISGGKLPNWSCRKLWRFICVSGRKAIKKTSTGDFNEQRYGQDPLVSLPVSSVGGSTSSNTLTHVDGKDQKSQKPDLREGSGGETRRGHQSGQLRRSVEVQPSSSSSPSSLTSTSFYLHPFCNP
jgi:hypothetical protein